jgi:hypothetical protein
MALIIEKNDAAFNAQLKNFVNKIDTYKATLGLSADEVSSVTGDALAFDYVVTSQLATQTFAQNYTSYKNLLRKGGEVALGVLPVLPALAAPPAMPLPNLESRFRNLLQRITHSNAYTEAMGLDLGIESPAATASRASLDAGKPDFFIELSSGGHPNLRWTKGRYQGVEIWKDSGSGFAKLDRDMRPDYIDKTNLPPAGATALWKYKMVYLLDDEPIGQWSNVVVVTVHGEV